jgi:excisionase family DNA binding protein
VTDEYVSLPVPARMLHRVALAIDEYRTKPRGHPDPDSGDLAVLAATARALYRPGSRPVTSDHDRSRHVAGSVADAHEAADATLLSLGDVAGRLDVSLRTVQRLIQGDGLPTVLIGARRRVRPEALQLWLDQQQEV